MIGEKNGVQIEAAIKAREFEGGRTLIMVSWRRYIDSSPG
jgi:hypothetical protein